MCQKSANISSCEKFKIEKPQSFMAANMSSFTIYIACYKTVQTHIKQDLSNNSQYGYSHFNLQAYMYQELWSLTQLFDQDG